MEDKKLCKSSWGLRLQGRLDKLDQWCKRNGIGKPLPQYMTELIQVRYNGIHALVSQLFLLL